MDSLPTTIQATEPLNLLLLRRINGSFNVSTTLMRGRITVLSQIPTSFAHSGCVVNEHLLIFGGFCDDLTQNHTLLLQSTESGVPADAKMYVKAISLIYFHRFQLRVRGEIPPPRERHSCSIVAGKKIYVFGGFNRTSDMYYNSLFSFDSGRMVMTLLLTN